MVNEELLRELSAPIEDLRPRVKDVYKQLDDQWNLVASHLKRLAIPCKVGFTLYEDLQHPDDCVALEWRKFKGSRRICKTVYQSGQTPWGDYEVSEDITPIDEWSAETKLELLKHVPDLFKSAVNDVKRFVERAGEGSDQ